MARYKFTGSYQTLSFLANKKYFVELWGAAGGGNSSSGDYANLIIQNTANLTLYLYIGGSPKGNKIDQENLAGWNGGGAGGNAYVNLSPPDGSYLGGKGFGGGGATDLRTSTSSGWSYRILSIAGSGGGGGSNGTGGWGGPDPGHGFPEPPQIVDGAYKSSTGGSAATEKSGGTGGLAPYCPAEDNGWTPTDIWYMSGGGGGGGGWYGGGGGSTNCIMAKSATSGVAGSSGGAGQGGAGGSATTTAKACYGPNYDSGGGGGGFTYIKPGLAYIKKSLISSEQGFNDGYGYSQNREEENHGAANVYEILSTPTIESCVRVGDKVEITIGKTSEGQGVDEIFFYKTGEYRLTYSDTPIEINTGTKTIIFNLNKNVTGDKGKFSFSVMNAEGVEVKTSFEYPCAIKAPIVSFDNKSISSQKFIQGSVVNNLLLVEMQYPNMNYITELRMKINGKWYPYTFSYRDKGDTSIQLPYIFDGEKNETYQLVVSARACNTGDNHQGNGKDVWSEWIESDSINVVATKPIVNRYRFITDFKDRAIEKDTKLLVEWEESDIKDYMRYRAKEMLDFNLVLFQDDNIIETWDCDELNKEVVLAYPGNKLYRFGISVMMNGFLSNIIYGNDYFYLSDIKTDDKVKFDANLNIETSFENFSKIQLFVNSALRISSNRNLQEQLQLWHFSKGKNEILIKVFTTNNHYVSIRYDAYITIDGTVEMIKKFDINSSISVNSGSALQLEKVGDRNVDMGIIESEYEVEIPDVRNAKEITQKFTIKKTNTEDNFTTQVIELTGYVE